MKVKFNEKLMFFEMYSKQEYDRKNYNIPFFRLKFKPDCHKKIQEIYDELELYKSTEMIVAKNLSDDGKCSYL